MNLSNAVYEAIDTPTASGEHAHKVILRDCLGTLAVALENSYKFGCASDATHSRMLGHFAQNGLTTNNITYAPYPEYRAYARNIRRTKPKLYSAPDAALAEVFAAYGDIARATWDTQGNPEPDSRHAVHVTALAAPYALREYPDLDASLVSSYSLVHDILEWHAGDTPTLNLSTQGHVEKETKEAEALELFCTTFSPEYPKLVTLVTDYEELVNDEAKYVKTFDKLDPGFTHFGNKGKAIKELGIDSPETFWREHHNTYVRMSRYALDFPRILEDRDTRAQMIEELAWPSAQ
ncbi:MAG: hypothetical protein UY35_C0014G0025 [Candidatus Saccharibacteria bacterium GW2011_GWC2_48_9]|nr:MAG: hypothetical protein UY35_C0014G0025 [Candidatus Saccharibacteria bacterium GW2011_GWC2_48_9]